MLSALRKVSFVQTRNVGPHRFQEF